jgi:hypothetical protein
MNPILRANSMNTSNPSTPPKDDFWNWVESKNTSQDKHIKLCKEITKQHFGGVDGFDVFMELALSIGFIF